MIMIIIVAVAVAAVGAASIFRFPLGLALKHVCCLTGINLNASTVARFGDDSPHRG
jgi:hypothetical protein